MSILKLIWNFFFRKKKATTENVTQELREFHKQIATVEEEPQAEETIIIPPQEFRDVSKQNNLIPERFEGESFDEYKNRRRVTKEFLKRKKQGIMVWNTDKQGTFKGDTSKLK